MVKKSGGKRKGISKGVQKGPPASNRKPNSEHSWLASTIKKFIALEKLTQLTESAFNIFLRASVAFHIVPLEQTEEAGHYDVPTGLRILPFWLYKMSTLMVTVYRLGVALTLAQTEEITPPLLLAVALSLASVFIWMMSEWSPADTAFMSKNSRSLLKDISREESRKCGKFDPPGLCVKVVGSVLLIPMCAACISLTTGVLYLGLPTSWCRLAMSYGWLNVESEDSVIWWLIILLPLEFVNALGPLMTAAYVCVNTFVGQQAIKTYGQYIRKIDVVDLKSRRQVEQLYIRWQVYIQASNNWTKVMAFPLLLGISGAITVTLFLTIRFTDAPIFIYVLFPFLSFSLLFLMALSSYDAVSVTEISQQVLSGQLLSFHNSHKLQLLSRDQRKLVARRAKAFKPIAFPIGPFTEVTYSVMANIWEEILNQLLFFLSF